MPVRKNYEAIEQAKAYYATGMSQNKIAEALGVHRRTVQRWLETEDPPDLAKELEEIRRKRALSFAEKAWNIADKILVILEEKVNAGHTSFKDAREVATCLGIVVDKINVLESRGKHGSVGTAIQINIMPPGGTDGDTPKADRDTVQIHDKSGTVLGDDSGSRVRKNLYRLSAGSPDES